MQGTRYRKPPFDLVRTKRGGLAEQLAAEFRRAIRTGYYRAGDVLPPTRELSSMLKVSRVVAVRLPGGKIEQFEARAEPECVSTLQWVSNPSRKKEGNQGAKKS